MKKRMLAGGVAFWLFCGCAGQSVDKSLLPLQQPDSIALQAADAHETPDLTHPPGDPTGETLRNASEWTQPLAPAFQYAAATYDVPLDLLVALAWIGSHLENRGEIPTIEGGYGVMALRENDLGGNSLALASTLLKTDRGTLVRDPAMNIVGAAAVLSAYADTAGADRGAGTEAWLPAVIKYAGLDEEDSRFFAMGVYERLHIGLDTTNSRGERFTTQPLPLRSISLQELIPAGLKRISPAELAQQQASTTPAGGLKQLPFAQPLQIAATPDYSGAIWDPAPTCNYSSAVTTKNTVIIHTAEGSAAGTRSWFKNCDRADNSHSSSHYVVSETGGVWQMVEERLVAWHAGCVNSYSVGIEHEGYAASGHTQALYDASAALTASICDRWGIAKVHNTCPPGILGHVDANICVCGPGHTDPDPGWDWSYYISKVNGLKFMNSIQNGGFESDMTSWSAGTGTTADIVTAAPHAGAKYCKVHRAGAYSTVYQNANEITGQTWRTTCWAYAAPGMTSCAFGFKNQSGVAMASVPVTATSWAFHAVDWTISDDIDVQIWGTGDTGVFMDDVRSGKASRMNWITDWTWNGAYGADLNTDYLSGSGGETNACPYPGRQQGGHTWTAVSRPDGYIDLNGAMGGIQSNCVVYANIYVIADAPKSNVNVVVGSDDGIKVFLNGTAVFTNNADRGQDYFNPDQDVVSGLSLNQGENRLLLKVRQGTGAYSFSARLCDNNGDAISGLTYRTSSSAQYVADTIPANLYTKQPTTVSVTMKNTGAAAWTQAGGYKLGAVGDSDPFASYRQLLDPADSIAPGASKTFTFTMTGPATAGTYSTDWRMVQEGVQWFGEPAIKSITVLQSIPGDMDFDTDVDQADFGAFQRCLKGTGNAQTDPACAAAKLNGDESVDGADFVIFSKCMSGPGIPGSADCPTR